MSLARTVVLVLVGWHPVTGQPAYLHACPVEQVLDSVEFDNLIRSRNAQALVTLRSVELAERERAGEQLPSHAGVVNPGLSRASGAAVETNSDSLATSPPLIAWRPEVERWRPHVSRWFLPGDVEHALAIIRCESLGDPEATNPSSGTVGLFQHRPAYWPARSLAAGWAASSPYDPEASIAVAAWLVYQGGGWAHWSGAAWGVDSCEEWAREQGV